MSQINNFEISKKKNAGIFNTTLQCLNFAQTQVKNFFEECINFKNLYADSSIIQSENFIYRQFNVTKGHDILNSKIAGAAYICTMAGLASLVSYCLVPHEAASSDLCSNMLDAVNLRSVQIVLNPVGFSGCILYTISKLSKITNNNSYKAIYKTLKFFFYILTGPKIANHLKNSIVEGRGIQLLKKIFYLLFILNFCVNYTYINLDIYNKNSCLNPINIKTPLNLLKAYIIICFMGFISHARTMLVWSIIMEMTYIFYQGLNSRITTNKLLICGHTIGLFTNKIAKIFGLKLNYYALKSGKFLHVYDFIFAWVVGMGYIKILSYNKFFGRKEVKLVPLKRTSKLNQNTKVFKILFQLLKNPLTVVVMAQSILLSWVALIFQESKNNTSKKLIKIYNSSRDLYIQKNQAYIKYANKPQWLIKNKISVTAFSIFAGLLFWFVLEYCKPGELVKQIVNRSWSTIYPIIMLIKINNLKKIDAVAMWEFKTLAYSATRLNTRQIYWQMLSSNTKIIGKQYANTFFELPMTIIHCWFSDMFHDNWFLCQILLFLSVSSMVISHILSVNKMPIELSIFNIAPVHLNSKLNKQDKWAKK